MHAQEGFASVHVSGWPTVPKKYDAADKIGAVVVEALAAVRKHKSEKKLSMKAPIKQILLETDVDVTPALADLQSTTSAQAIELKKGTKDVLVQTTIQD